MKAIEISASNSLLHHKHVIIESNSANVISWMNNPENKPWLHYKLFSSAKRLALCFDSITFTYSIMSLIIWQVTWQDKECA